MTDPEQQPYDVCLSEIANPAPWGLETPYEQWRQSQGIPVHTGFYVQDITKLETAHWDLIGAEAAFVELDGAADTTSAYVVMADSNSTTKWQRHIYEALVYVASGDGITEVKSENHTVTCRWKAGSVFAIPLNIPYRHVVGSEGAVLYCVTTAPPVVNLFHHEEFIHKNEFQFRDRFDDSESFFNPTGTMWRAPEGLFSWETNLIEDVVSMEIPPLEGRGAGGHNLTFQFAEGVLMAHVSEFPKGTYKKAHYHGPSAHVIILAGSGYSLCWNKDFEDHTKVDWNPNAVFVPPDQWWHQHFNVGASPARYLALRTGSMKRRLDHSYDGVNTDSKQGGNQLEYGDQDPRVHAMFVDACREHGVTVDERGIGR